MSFIELIRRDVSFAIKTAPGMGCPQALTLALEEAKTHYVWFNGELTTPGALRAVEQGTIVIFGVELATDVVQREILTMLSEGRRFIIITHQHHPLVGLFPEKVSYPQPSARDIAEDLFERITRIV